MLIDSIRDHFVQGHGANGEGLNFFHEAHRDTVPPPLRDSRGGYLKVGGKFGAASLAGIKPRIDVHADSLAVSKPSRQDFSKPSLFSIRLMNDAARRAAFLHWFNGAPCKGDRYALIRKSGLTKGRISQLFDPDQQFGERAAASLAQRLGLTPGFFSAPPAPSAENVISSSMGATMVPIISSVQAGGWCEAVEPFHEGAAGDWLMTDSPVSKSAFALEVQGASMQPDFQPGDRIIVDPEVRPLPGDFVVAKNGKEEATFKKFRPRGVNEAGEEFFELVPLNEDYPSMRSDVTPMRIIGTMVEHRKYRKR